MLEPIKPKSKEGGKDSKWKDLISVAGLLEMILNAPMVVLFEKMQQLLREGHSWNEMLYLSFEDERLVDFTHEDFNAIMECHIEMTGNENPMLFLDEIQNIEGWEHFARRLADGRIVEVVEYIVFDLECESKQFGKSHHGGEAFGRRMSGITAHFHAAAE